MSFRGCSFVRLEAIVAVNGKMARPSHSGSNKDAVSGMGKTSALKNKQWSRGLRGSSGGTNAMTAGHCEKMEVEGISVEVLRKRIKNLYIRDVAMV